MTRHPLAPRLWPLIRRFGLLEGLARWRQCRWQGCDWTALEQPTNTTALAHWQQTDGRWVHLGVTKVQCTCCGTTRLVRLEVITLPAGAGMFIRSPDGRVWLDANRKLKLI